jgi:hypothetical protein
LLRMSQPKTEIRLACDLIRILDGLSIEEGKNTLMRALHMLETTQIVSAESALLAVTDENAEVLRSS